MSNRKDINIHLSYAMSFILIIIMGILYQRYIQKHNLKKELNDLELVRYYLLNDSPEEKKLKTMMWIHIPYELNSRSWDSFYGRNSQNLNMPYIYLCIKSIIEKCGNCFHIVLIDDNSFKTLIPEFEHDITMLASPVKEKFRQLALTKVLFKFGGVLVPKSFLATKNMMPLYLEGINNDKPFFTERILNNQTFTSNVKFMGCVKECPTINEFSNFLENLCKTDHTDESNFLNLADKWLYDNLVKFNKICGSKIGIKDTNKNPIMLEDLFSEKHIKLHTYTSGILIPEEEINKRTAYNWFMYLPEEDLVMGNSMISKYFLLSHEK